MKTNWELLEFNQELMDAAIEEMDRKGIEIYKLKDVATYINSLPYPYQPERSKREDLDNQYFFPPPWNMTEHQIHPPDTIMRKEIKRILMTELP